MRNITKTVQSSFGVAARVGYPSGLSGMTEEISDPSYACVQGLIKHAMDDDVDISSGGDKKKSNVKGFAGKVGEWLKSLLP